MKSLKVNKGIAIIFISHRLQEVLDICDKILVLRDGKSVADLKPKETSIELNCKTYGGARSKFELPRFARENDEPILEVQNLYVDIHNLSKM